MELSKAVQDANRAIYILEGGANGSAYVKKQMIGLLYKFVLRYRNKEKELEGYKDKVAELHGKIAELNMKLAMRGKAR